MVDGCGLGCRELLRNEAAQRNSRDMRARNIVPRKQFAKLN